jgi:hypothetical protein
MSGAVDTKHIDGLFSGYGPLATFAAKGSLCYALGFIDEAVFRDLEIIRRIRNRFAHDHASSEFFDSATFQQLCAIQCTYPIGTPDYAGATLAELKQEILDFYPADGLEPESVEMSGARAKFLITVQILAVESACRATGLTSRCSQPLTGAMTSSQHAYEVRLRRRSSRRRSDFRFLRPGHPGPDRHKGRPRRPPMLNSARRHCTSPRRGRRVEWSD